MNIIESARGNYYPIGKISDADCVIGHSFGTMTGPDSVNYALAIYLSERADMRPIIVDRTLADASPKEDEAFAHIVEGEISNSVGKGVGTWGTLVESKKFMAVNELSTALMVAQACHIGRVVKQARKLGIESVVPKGLPDMFEPHSDQRWTRSKDMWVPREVLGSFVLRVQGKL